MAKKVLGKGLGAIISTSPTPVEDMEMAVSESRDRIVELDAEAVQPNPDQPRSNFDEEEINGLAESIRSMGLIQPILVRREGDRYFVIAGERRLRASKIAGLKKVKAIVIKTTEEDNLTLALIENIQRTNLNPIEEAKAYRVLINRFKLRQQDVAQKVGRDRATIANLMRLLTLPETIQHAIIAGTVSVGHAKVLLSFPPDRINRAYAEIVDRGLSVRALEMMADAENPEAAEVKKKGRRQSQKKDPHIAKMEDMLVSRLGTKVEIRHAGKRGRIEISYYSLDDFDRIIELLK
jgi:ParB family transcriptional regulator, chromosome partitioning protein